MGKLWDFEIVYVTGELKYLNLRAERLSRSDAYAEICFAEQLLFGHKPCDPALTFEILAKSVGIALVQVTVVSNDDPKRISQISSPSANNAN